MMTKEVCPKSESGKLRGIFKLVHFLQQLNYRGFLGS